ncbi:MAG: PAS domain S-box protein, partial [Deltaproteobacteria bacterium]|nr:PAS domain S-box protein [Deltaproteobacteria bacterium]
MRRRLPVRVVAVMFFIAALTIATLTAAAAETAVRVGLYENPPKIFTNEKGTPDGFFITILEYIAKREQWKLCYVPGTWSQCLDRLERGEIDLMPDVAYTDERAERYDFSEENVFINWSVIYAAPESHIRNIFDLESKKVALMKDAVAAVEFRSLTESFGVSCSSITVDTYEDVFRLIDTEEADAGVVNRLVGSALESAYDVVKTDIVCCPMELRFAAPKRGNPLLLAAIDRHLRTLKQDKQSLYYQQLYRWFEGIERVEYPRWVMILFVIAGVTFLIIATVLVISAVMVRVRTRGLNQEIERHRETAEKLRTSERLLKKTQELTRVGGWEYDVRTGKMVWTDEVYRIHEIPVDPSIDHVAASLKCYGPEGSRVIEEVFRRAVKEGVPYDLDVPFTTARGNRLWIRTIGNPVVEDGAVVRVVGNIMDITDRKNTEDTLRESEYRFRELFENMSSCVAIYEAVDGGEDFIFRDFNRAGESAEGLKREGLIGRRVTEVFPGVRDFGLFEVFRRVWRTGSPEKFPATMYHDDRIVGWRDNYVLRLPSGEVVAIYDDVTDRKRMEEALKESEEKFRTLFDEASDGILIADHVTKKFIEGNRAICSMLGYTKEEIAGLALHDIHLQKDISLVIDTFEKQFKREKIIASEIPVLRKDGSIFYADIGSYPLTFWGTNYLVGIFRDITDRKEAEEAIRESEKKYRDLYDFLPIPVYEMDLEGTITSANLAIYEVFRGTEEDLKNGISVWRLLPPEEVERTKSNIQRLLAGEQVGGVEYTLMRLDGTTFPAIVISRVICYDGRPVGFRGAIVDITAIRQAEEALRESEEQYRALINGMKETVWVIDFDGTIIDVNNTAVTLLGYSKEELLDIGLHGIDSSLAEDDIKTLAQAMLSDTLQIFETTHTAKDGRTFPVEVCSSLVTYRGRQMILSIARDITERKRAEEQIREYSENLERMVEERTEELNRALYDSREAR